MSEIWSYEALGETRWAWRIQRDGETVAGGTDYTTKADAERALEGNNGAYTD